MKMRLKMKQKNEFGCKFPFPKMEKAHKIEPKSRNGHPGKPLQKQLDGDPK